MTRPSALKKERTHHLSHNISTSRKIVKSVSKKTRQLQNDLISDTDRAASNENFTYNFKKSRKFLEKHGSSAHISLISLSKSDRFSKTHIYSERGIFSASSYVKNSISDFFRKTDFSEGGGPLKKCQITHSSGYELFSGIDLRRMALLRSKLIS